MNAAIPIGLKDTTAKMAKSASMPNSVPTPGQGLKRRAGGPPDQQ